MIFILLLSVEMKELYSRVCMCICVSQMLHAATFDLQNSSMSQCSTQTLLSCGKCLQVATKPIRLDNKLVQWVCAGFCEVIWLSEMQLGSILQWTSVLVSLLVSGSFPASALILLVVNLMSTTLSFPSLFFFSPPSAQCATMLSLPYPSLFFLSQSLFVSASDALLAPGDTEKDTESCIAIYLCT